MIKLIVDNDQDAFDLVARHLHGMTEQCMDLDGDACLYDDGLGGRCAVGALMDDPSPVATHLSSVDLLVAAHVLDVGSVSVKLLVELQTIHDDRLSWDPAGFDGVGKLRRLAHLYNLSPAVLDELWPEPAA